MACSYTTTVLLTAVFRGTRVGSVAAVAHGSANEAMRAVLASITAAPTITRATTTTVSIPSVSRTGRTAVFFLLLLYRTAT